MFVFLSAKETTFRLTDDKENTFSKKLVKLCMLLTNLSIVRDLVGQVRKGTYKIKNADRLQLVLPISLLSST